MQCLTKPFTPQVSGLRVRYNCQWDVYLAVSEKLLGDKMLSLDAGYLVELLFNYERILQYNQCHNSQSMN